MRIMTRTIRGAVVGATVGVAIAIVMISLDQLRPFSVSVNSFIEGATFRLCPLFIFGFSNSVKSMTVLVVITMLGNALLYGVLFALIALCIGLFQRKSRAQDQGRSFTI